MTNDMADMPVQHPLHPSEEAERRARYFNSGNAFNVKLPPVASHVFIDEPAQALRLAGIAQDSGYVSCDRSAQLGCGFAATTPLMLARYAHIAAGGALASCFIATGSIWYVIAGAGESRWGDETIRWRKGDIFLLPGGVESIHHAGADGAVLWVVSNEPQLAHDGLRPRRDGGAAPVHYPADEIARQIDRLYQAEQNDNTSGMALIFSSERQEASRNILPTLTLSFNTLPPQTHQRPHLHNSAAITLIVQGGQCHSMVAGEHCAWSQWATMITPPGALHSHHNDGGQRALFLIVQDGGLYYHARTMGFSFAE